MTKKKENKSYFVCLTILAFWELIQDFVDQEYGLCLFCAKNICLIIFRLLLPLVCATLCKIKKYYFHTICPLLKINFYFL